MTQSVPFRAFLSAEDSGPEETGRAMVSRFRNLQEGRAMLVIFEDREFVRWRDSSHLAYDVCRRCGLMLLLRDRHAVPVELVFDGFDRGKSRIL
ncbi:hypothetical protein LMTR3_21080 [Bradyrhizobium sp. LMTR 3]|nr:hypothetical protein LMTR3_21080 [Bradyrhizobium sp. LMTR 3]